MKQSKNQLWCDGPRDPEKGDGAYAEHPRVYFSWDASGRATCPYCGRVFVDEQNIEAETEDA